MCTLDLPGLALSLESRLEFAVSAVCEGESRYEVQPEATQAGHLLAHSNREKEL